MGEPNSCNFQWSYGASESFKVKDLVKAIGQDPGPDGTLVVFGWLYKKNWPTNSRAIKEAIFSKPVPVVLKTENLSSSKRLLHYFIIKKITPRNTNMDLVTISDCCLMEQA